MQRLPDEIVYNILSRLPVKKLLQFKSVCKLWHTTISDPLFAKLQLQQSLSQQNNSRILVFPNNKQKQPVCLDYENNDDRFAESQIDSPLVYTKYRHVFGYCDGLFGLAFVFKAFVWNPSIRQYRILPYSKNSLRHISYVGIGYDSVLDDYKVVRSIRGAPGKMMLEVFALKTNQWRTIGESYSGFISNHRQSSNFLNGSLHWFDDIYSLVKTKLVAFNLASEKFLELPLPDVNDVELSMVVFDGCLCVYSVDNDINGIEIWVMKEYMVSASWTKLGAVPFHTIPNCEKYLRPLSCARNGDILLQIEDEQVVKYNMNEKCCSAVFNIKYSDSVGRENNDFLHAHAYVESMISLYYDDGMRPIV